MKLLLYCTKGKPLFRSSGDYDEDWGFKNFFDEYVCAKDYYNYHRDYETVDEEDLLNGKVVAECDYEIKDLKYSEELLKNSCLTASEIFNYIKKSNTAYEIHIKNLHIFDEPRQTKWYGYTDKEGYLCMVEKAPQNMMYCYDEFGNDYALISIQPQWLCKILNGEKTIEIRKKVLRGML